MCIRWKGSTKQKPTWIESDFYGRIIVTLVNCATNKWINDTLYTDLYDVQLLRSRLIDAFDDDDEYFFEFNEIVLDHLIMRSSFMSLFFLPFDSSNCKSNQKRLDKNTHFCLW